MHRSAAIRRLRRLAAHVDGAEPSGAATESTPLTLDGTPLTDVGPLLYPMSRGENLGSPSG